MVQVKTYAGGSVSQTEVDPAVFGDRVLGRTLKDAIVMYEANRRQGTAKVKGRTEVNGPNKKLWPQKHTGRARMGSQKSPLWRGGGVIFGPSPRDYSFHMPVKARRVALCNALFTKFRDGEVTIADGWPQDKPSTRKAVKILQALGLERSVLVVTDQVDTVLRRSLRNLPQIDICPASDLNAHLVLLRRHMVVTPKALAMLQEKASSVKKKPARTAKPSRES